MTTRIPDAPNDYCLEARDISHQFQPTWWVLKEVSLRLRRGELVGVVGPNGSGKSTLMRILVGQIHPRHGQVRLGDASRDKLPRAELARRIGYLPQSIQASFDYTVEEIVAHGRYPHQRALGILSHHDVEIVHQAMQWTQTDAFAKRTLDELSGGERQRVMLASVLAQGGEFLLLDEPTNALDIDRQVDVFERIRSLSREGLGILVIIHDLNLAAQYCDRLVMLHEGRLIAEGAPECIMTEAVLKKVYTSDLIIDRNPVTGAPMVVLLGRHGASMAQRYEAERGEGI